MTERLYLKNPYLREIESRIVEKKYKNNKYYLTLNRTIFYPNLAGGQPGDKGTINGIKVSEVYEENNNIIHVLNENIYSDKVLLSINWDNRFDLMQQHSGQHLLSSVFYKLYDAKTVGFYIGHDYVYIDVTLPEISDEIVKKVEQFANKIIFSNFDIKTYTIGKSDIRKIPVNKEPTVNSNIRIVEIDGIDYSPCCGTHHRSTGEIGLIKIRNWEKYKGNTRVEFVCGNRALKDYSWKNKYIKNIANLLSSKDLDIYKKVKKLYDDNTTLERENKLLREELLKYKGKELLENSETCSGLNIIKKNFTDLDSKELHFISNILTDLNNNIVLISSKNKDKNQFVLSRSKNLNINMKKILKEISQDIDIRGGGNNQSVQGGCSVENSNKILNIAYKLCKSQIQ